MGKFSGTHFFILFLIFTASIMVLCANYAQQRCMEELYSKGCTLQDCGKRCFERRDQVEAHAFITLPWMITLVFVIGIVVNTLISISTFNTYALYITNKGKNK